MAPKDPELEALKAEINGMIDKFKVCLQMLKSYLNINILKKLF